MSVHMCMRCRHLMAEYKEINVINKITGKNETACIYRCEKFRLPRPSYCTTCRYYSPREDDNA